MPLAPTVSKSHVGPWLWNRADQVHRVTLVCFASRQGNRHRWLRWGWNALRGWRRWPGQCGPTTRPSVPRASQGGASVDHIRRSVDPCRWVIWVRHDPIQCGRDRLWCIVSGTWPPGAVAIEEMGGPKIPWKSGRTDFVDDSKCAPRGRLPDASQAHDHLRKIFYRMGFNDQEIVALSGAHNLGVRFSFTSPLKDDWLHGTKTMLATEMPFGPFGLWGPMG